MDVATTWNPEAYAKNARFVSDLGEPLLDLLAARPGERIFDLGCGDGALTEKIAAAGCIVYGADASFAQVAAARRRGLRAFVMDARQMATKRLFDGVFSNAVLHWIQPPEKVIEGVAQCLKPGGRFVGEFGGQGNVQTIRTALHKELRKRGVDPQSVDPWYYPSTAEYSALLARFGFAIDSIDLIPRPTKLPGDILGWLETFAQPFSGSLADAEREDYLQEIRRELKPALCDAHGTWHADYVRLRVRAIAPS